MKLYKTMNGPVVEDSDIFYSVPEDWDRRLNRDDRFVRPIAYQNFPQPALPLEVQDSNPGRIWRLIDGEMSREAL